MNPELFRAFLESAPKRQQEPVTPEQLKSMFNSMQEPHAFEVGQIVEWKEGLSNKKLRMPAIVCRVLPEVIFDSSEESCSAYFREPLDMVIGAIDSDGDFIEVYVDSRRFKPVN